MAARENVMVTWMIQVCLIIKRSSGFYVLLFFSVLLTTSFMASALFLTRRLDHTPVREDTRTDARTAHYIDNTTDDNGPEYNQEETTTLETTLSFLGKTPGVVREIVSQTTETVSAEYNEETATRQETTRSFLGETPGVVKEAVVQTTETISSKSEFNEEIATRQETALPLLGLDKTDEEAKKVVLRTTERPSAQAEYNKETERSGLPFIGLDKIPLTNEIKEVVSQRSSGKVEIISPTQQTQPSKPPEKYNVLFLVSDDLRPQLNSYRGAHNPNPYNNFRMYTPNLDALAQRSLQLNRAYVQFSVCSPSRTSYMTGRRPDTTGVWDLETHWRDAGGNFTTIPQYFKNNGYITKGMGKIYHPGSAGESEDVLSWSEPYYYEPNGLFYQLVNDSWWAVPESFARAKPLHDEGITYEAIRFMTQHVATASERPFFLAIGFQKPHIPFVFPKRYLKYYPLKNMELASNRFAPYNFPHMAWFHFEGGNYADMKSTNTTGRFNETLPDKMALLYKRAYFACVTFVDDMVGRLVSAVEELGLGQNTIISFIGDHGFHLGENGMWGKHTNLEQSTHAPVMIRIPGKTDAGLQSDSLVEFVDLFPTLAEVAGLDPVPSCPEKSGGVLTCTEGKSFVKLVNHPKRRFKSRAISQVARWRIIGYTLRTDRYRYVEWTHINKTELSASRCRYDLLWGGEGREYQELYDHKRDPEENYNLVEKPDYRDVIKAFSREVREFVQTPIVSTCSMV